METRESLKKMIEGLTLLAVQVREPQSRIAKMLGQLDLSFSGKQEIEILTIAAQILELKTIVDDTAALALAKFSETHKEGDEVVLPEVDKKVVWPVGTEKTSIDSAKLVKELLDAGRRADVIKIVEISEKSLKELKDGPVLIAKYKKSEGKKNSSVAIKPLTKEEHKKLVEAR